VGVVALAAIDADRAAAHLRRAADLLAHLLR
jgi:hypothetical protein